MKLSRLAATVTSPSKRNAMPAFYNLQVAPIQRANRTHLTKQEQQSCLQSKRNYSKKSDDDEKNKDLKEISVFLVKCISFAIGIGLVTSWAYSR